MPHSTKARPRKNLSAHLSTKYVSIQKNYCFGCGKANPDGMRLRFTFDEQRNCFVSRFRLGKRYTGPPGHCHGGIIATILDEAMGKPNRMSEVVALTRTMKVDYLKPVPLNKPLRVEARAVSIKGRYHVNQAEILNANNEVMAKSEGLFIAIDPQKMFAKHLAAKGRHGK